MQNSQAKLSAHRRGGNVTAEPADRNDAYHVVVEDLVALVEHIQTSLRSIEQEIARETASGSQETSGNVIELDDVTPPYVQVSTALKACDANLGLALRSLLDSKIWKQDAADAWSRPARASA